MDSLYIIIPLFIVGIIIQLANLFSKNYKEYFDKIPYLKMAIFWLSIIFIVFGGYQTIDSLRKTKKHEVYASPSEIKMRSKIIKDFVLTISNNKDEAVYDVLCGICLDKLSIDQSIIKIEPVKKEITPNVPFSLLGLILSNGCSTMSVQNISPNSSKEFYVSVNGENIDINFRISFLIYQWELKPSQFRFPTTKEQFQNPPKNFNKFFGEKSSDKEKTGQTWAIDHKVPTNPYFPDIKEAAVLKAWFYRN